jgi:hypothetical protein
VEVNAAVVPVLVEPPYSVPYVLPSVHVVVKMFVLIVSVPEAATVQL